VIITGRQAWAVKRTMLMRVRHVPSKVSHEGAENKAKAKPNILCHDEWVKAGEAQMETRIQRTTKNNVNHFEQRKSRN